MSARIRRGIPRPESKMKKAGVKYTLVGGGDSEAVTNRGVVDDNGFLGEDDGTATTA